MAEKKEKNVTPSEETRSIPIHLIINGIKCIDAAAKRGAYHGGEMSTIGYIRDNLYQSVADVIEKAEEEQNPSSDKSKEKEDNVIPFSKTSDSKKKA